MNRGEVWWAEIASKRRPVLLLTRTEVVALRELVTVAEITTNARGLSVEVPIDAESGGLPNESVINCDGLYTIRRSSLQQACGEVDDQTMARVCRAISHAVGC
ncbi:MAG: type II toxin-antitoxin system PemK/MazF family toxin [bacterium]|nr:type II toxin-antitoxin system PemK/MazF family toxin [bacterium]